MLFISLLLSFTDKNIKLCKFHTIFLVFIVLTTNIQSSCLSCLGSYKGHSGNKLVTTPCDHKFHLYCITRCLNAGGQSKVKKNLLPRCPACNKLAVPLIPQLKPHIHLKSPYCETAEMYACRVGSLKKLKMLLTKSKRKEHKRWDKSQNISLLHIAAKYGNDNCLQALINDGESSNVAIDDGTTPLHMAVENDHVGCAEILLNASANVNASLKKSRITPIYIAILKGHIDCINLLLNRGQANMNDSLGPDGATLLYIASMNGDIKVVKYLLNANANINLFVDDNAWKTPMYTAIYNGNDDCVNALIKAGSDFRAIDNNTGQTYLNLATINGYNNIVQCLIREDLSLQRLHTNMPTDENVSTSCVLASTPVSKLKYKVNYTAVPATNTALETTAMPQAVRQRRKCHHTPKASPKVCELEKDIAATSLTGQVVKDKAGIAVNYIQQKIKHLSREKRSYWVRKCSDFYHPKKVTTEQEGSGLNL